MHRVAKACFRHRQTAARVPLFHQRGAELVLSSPFLRNDMGFPLTQEPKEQRDDVTPRAMRISVQLLFASSSATFAEVTLAISALLFRKTFLACSSFGPCLHHARFLLFAVFAAADCFSMAVHVNNNGHLHSFGL